MLRVAWQGESVTISEVALRRIADCRRSFLRLIDSDADLSIYGVTTAMGELASRRLDADERARHARIKAFAAATAFGDTLPDRVVRGIVLARLANFLEGHAATTPPHRPWRRRDAERRTDARRSGRGAGRCR